MFDQLEENDHEQIAFFSDTPTGLKAIVAIHNTVLGPSMGGTRFWSYNNDQEAIVDVLRLSRGMTYKSSISGLNIGGGKAVIIGDPRKLKTPELLKKFGEFVEGLNGQYVTAEDVNMTEADMEHIGNGTQYVVGKSVEKGGNGDPSPVTAYTTYMGMKAGAKKAFGADSLEGKKILVQGAGHVGMYLIEHLKKEGAKVLVNDIFSEKVEAAVQQFGVEAVSSEGLFDHQIDIYSPCALGATVNDDTLAKLKCKVIAGAANNQLENEWIHGQKCKDLGIVYCPDFLINSGGIINVCAEFYKESKESAFKQAEYVYQATLDVFEKAEREGTSTHQAALNIAEERIKKAQITNKNVFS